jgi:hypothetical protein
VLNNHSAFDLLLSQPPAWGSQKVLGHEIDKKTNFGMKKPLGLEHNETEIAFS